MSKKIIIAVVVLVLGLLAFFFLSGRAGDTRINLVGAITCDAESVSGNYFVNGGISFINGATQSEERAHSGTFSSKLTTSQKNGFGINLINLHPGDNIDVSCWVYGEFNKSVLFAKGLGNFDFEYSDRDELDNISEYVRANIDYSKWRKVSMKLLIVSPIDTVSLKIYTKLPDDCENAFVDDLTITKFDAKKYNAPAAMSGIRKIRIDLDSVALGQLNAQRMQAMHDGIIINYGDYLMGKMTFDSIKSYVKLRLKGDWPDHLEKIKWSLRVKTKDINYCDRLKVFSIQAPHTKNYLNEWVVHKMMEQEDVLTPRYDFVYFNMNGRDQGLYAREEHFVKQLLESKSRREGPIVKFSEDEMWAASLVNTEKHPDKLIMKSAVAVAFNTKKIKKSPVIRSYFRLAQNLMYQYKHGLKKPDEIFNLEKLAQYYALVDVTRSTHAIKWHNQRFYYNPIIGKLEPIYFDGFVAKGEFDPKAKFIIERSELPKHMQNIFSDPEFITLFKKYGKKYSSQEWLDQFFESQKKDIEKYEKAILQEYPEYKFYPEFFYKRAEEFSLKLNQEAENHKYNESILGEIDSRLPITAGMSVVAFRSRYGTDSLKVKVLNYHNGKVVILGIGKDSIMEKAKGNISLKPYATLGIPDSKEIDFTIKSKYVFYKVGSNKRTYRTKIFKQPPPKNYTPVQDLISNSQRPSQIAGVIIKNKDIIFPSGKYSLTKPLVIPQGFKVTFKPGATIDILKGASFISYSPIYSIGTKSNPVKVTSSDMSAKGFTILQPNGKCEFTNTIFDKLKPLEYKGWNLTGCVTIYKANVELTNVKILNTDGEDALNLVRCEFTMDQCEISGTLSDAFDGDFCQGTVESTLFTKVGNDALDYSGSDITVNDVRIVGAGDKGISSGENSRIKVSNVQITNANLGIASKDLSNVYAEDVKLNNVKIGFLAYQKKSEYGGATIEVKSSSLINVPKQHNIAPGSFLILNGTRIVGKDFISSELF